MARIIVAAAVCGLFIGYGTPVAGAIIDDFTQNANHSVSITGVGGPTSDTQGVIPFANTIGGFRTLTLEVLSSGAGTTSELGVNTAFGNVSYSNGSQNNSVGMITWDANGAGLGGADLTDGGVSNTFQAFIQFSDLNLGFELDITDTGGDVATFSSNLGAGPSLVSEPFLNFVNAAAVDFSSVDAIQLTLTGPQAQDATFTLLRTTFVPEPSSLALMLLGLSGCGFVAYRRRQEA